MSRTRLVLRFLRIAFVFLWALPRYAWRRMSREEPLDELARERLRGDVLADTLERLGATFVKFGQILGSRPDLLGPGYVDALARLQDRVPPEPFDRIEEVLKSELGEKLALFRSIEPTPIAAASVAQVHQAWLETGERLALKIQRPNAPEQIEGDLSIMALGARILDRLPSVHLLSLPGAVERFASALRGQLDFRAEAEHNRRFAANFEKLHGVRVPELFDSLCTARVLAMEYVDGVKATAPSSIVGKARKRLGARGAQAILQMVFEDGFVHADLHPGNILLTEDGTMVFLDLGLVAEIPKDLMKPWIDTFTALGKQDGRTAAKLFYSYSPSVATPDYASYERDVIVYFEKLAGLKLGDVEVSQVVGGMMNILRKHRIQVEPTFTVVHIGLLVAEGLGKQLDPDIDLVQMALPFLGEAVKLAPTGRAPFRTAPS
jgi:ubiquinone biosynthesis protein